jgi:hypothetical protein
MPGIPTEVLGEMIEQTNRRLADEVHALGGKVDHAERRLDDFRVEVATELGKINATLESIRTRVDSTASIGKWTVGVLTPVVISLVGAALGIAWYAGRLDSRLEHVEKAVGAAEKPGATRR